MNRNHSSWLGRSNAGGNVMGCGIESAAGPAPPGSRVKARVDEVRSRAVDSQHRPRN